MSEQKFAEFRERAEIMVSAADPDVLLQRGRSLRRRRQLAPMVAVAAIAAVGYGIFALGGDGVRDDQRPVGTPSVTPTPSVNHEDEPLAPGTWALDYLEDAEPDATLEVFGEGWDSFSDGVYKSEAASAVSVGIGRYGDIVIDRCEPLRRATASPSAAVRQLSRIPGTVTVPPSRATALGLTGTHLQLSIPVDLECPDGATPAMANLQAVFDGPSDPTVTVDVWLLENDDGMLMLTKGVRGHPSTATLEELNQTLDSLRLP